MCNNTGTNIIDTCNSYTMDMRKYFDINRILETTINMDSRINNKHVFWQPWLNTDEPNKASTKQLPTTKWKHDRRRLPEYSRKSDPKLPENGLHELNNGVDRTSTSNGTETREANSKSSNNKKDADSPLDMSLRQRGLPPSYSQTISNPSYRTNYRPSVITQNSSPPSNARMGSRNDMPSGISMCDPIIDEHFRRSLGKDYVMLFSNNNKNVVEADPLQISPERMSKESVRELIDEDPASLSVDDHFAKALGDTWLKLNQKDNEIKEEIKDEILEKPSIVSL